MTIVVDGALNSIQTKRPPCLIIVFPAKDPDYIQVDSKDSDHFHQGWSESSVDTQVILFTLSCSGAIRTFHSLRLFYRRFYDVIAM